MLIDVEMVNPGRFTPREADVAVQMVKGFQDKKIARLLGISYRTVAIHSAHIYEKLGMHLESAEANVESINCRARAVAVMVARGVVSVSFKTLVVLLIVGAMQLDDGSAARVRHGRIKIQVVRLRGRADA